jgi:hypothetical protein
MCCLSFLFDIYTYHILEEWKKKQKGNMLEKRCISNIVHRQSYKAVAVKAKDIGKVNVEY